jgi:two-component system sensor histidine kinase YesM
MVSMEDITKSANSLRNKLSNIIFWSVLLNVVVSVLITLLIYRPFRKFIDKLDRPSEKALNIDPIDYNYTELNHIGTKFDDLIKRINALITENYIKDIAKKEATVKQLQAQINPHVMFNSLQLLQTEIVCGNKEESNKIILSLSSLLRYSMNQTQEIVPLEKEINHIKQYLYIMNQKYRNKIRLDNMISLKVQQNYKVVKLTIQPIIENCIKHGFDPQQSDKTIKIEACIAEDVLSIVISNNGLNIPEKKVIEMNKAFSKASSKAESIGLYNVNQRIQLICGSKYGLKIESEVNQWTKVKLCLPLNLME